MDSCTVAVLEDGKITMVGEIPMRTVATLTVDKLAALGGRLQLPDGWEYQTPTPADPVPLRVFATLA